MRRGKITPLKVLEKFPELMGVFGCLGGNVTCSTTLLDNLERFVSCMYGKAQISSVNKFRYYSFQRNTKAHLGRYSVPSLAWI